MATMLRPAHIPADRVVNVNIYALPGMEDDYQRSWSDLQSATAERIWTPQNEGNWIAMRGEVLAEVQSDHERFSSRILVIPKSMAEQHGLIPTTIDPPAHRPYRLLLSSTFSPAAVRQMSDRIRATAAELIESFCRDGQCDFTNQYAQIFPIRLFMAIVDLPMADASSIQLWAESMTRPEPAMPFDAAKKAFYDYLAPILTARRDQPGDDLISYMITADIGGRMLDEQEALAISTQILIAGVDTVVNFLGFAMLFLARNPDARHALAADPESILQATHELFRRFGLVTVAREVRHDMDYRGVQLKAGDVIALPTEVHGIDDHANADPLRVDFDRKRARHSAFGSGPHMCPGQELARVEVAITIEEWLERIPDFEDAGEADTHCGGGIVGSIKRLVLKWETK